MSEIDCRFGINIISNPDIEPGTALVISYTDDASRPTVLTVRTTLGTVRVIDAVKITNIATE